MSLERRPKIALVFIDETEAVQVARQPLPITYLAVKSQGLLQAL
jgi:hypothetical protein